MTAMPINDEGAKLRILSEGQPFYVIKHMDKEYIEILLSGRATVMHTDWLHASWWTSREEAQGEIAESVRHIYTVHEIQIREEKIEQ